MIYPTRTAITAVVAGLPVTLLVALLVPERWYAALAWPAAVVALTLIDGLIGARANKARARRVSSRRAWRISCSVTLWPGDGPEAGAQP